MTYLWLLRCVSRLTGRLLKHADHDKSWWSWVAYYDGKIAFRQLRYVERVQRASGWEPVEVSPAPLKPWTWTVPTVTTTTTAASATFRINGLPMHDD